MDYLIALIFITLALILWRINGRDQYHIMSGLQCLMALILFFWLGQDLDSENGYTLTGLMTGILLFHFILSRFWKSKAPYWPILFVLISSMSFFLFQDEVFLYQGYNVSLSQLPILLLPVLGASMGWIATMKENFLGKWFQIDFKNRRGLSRSMYVFLIGFLVFLGHLNASFLGITMVTLGFGSSLLYHKKSGAEWNMFLGLIAITSIGHLAHLGGIDTSNLLQGRVLEGLLFGGFISLFINTVLRARKNKIMAELLSWLLMILIPTVLILLGAQFVSLGGTDAFIGLIIGFAISALFGINTRKNSSALALYLALGTLLIPITINKEAEDMTTISLTTNKKEGQPKEEEKQQDIFENPGLPIDINGLYRIDAKNSQLTFELGQTGSRTKGAFKSFSAEFNLSETTKTINVNLPVKELSTFNSYRDESLMEETYFNVKKFPNISYQASSMLSVDDKYIAKGKFTMLGITLDKEVELKYLGQIGVNSAPVFIGRAQIDRTKHGMKSDPKEGDIVDFTFKVELVKN
jgi:polyisoprenoid-binding protein YceI